MAIKHQRNWYRTAALEQYSRQLNHHIVVRTPSISFYNQIIVPVVTITATTGWQADAVAADGGHVLLCMERLQQASGCEEYIHIT